MRSIKPTGRVDRIIIVALESCEIKFSMNLIRKKTRIHQCEQQAIYKVPKGINIKIEKQTKINISGTDKALVSKVASEIKSLKPVEPYKGKGIKEKDQYVIRKEGKKK